LEVVEVVEVVEVGGKHEKPKSSEDVRTSKTLPGFTPARINSSFVSFFRLILQKHSQLELKSGIPRPNDFLEPIL